MPPIITARMTADPGGPFVLFLIGFRINKPLKPHRWLPVFLAMPKMLRELTSDKSLGLLHYRLHLGLRGAMVVQYWRSFAHLESYAKSRTSAHLPAWKAFNTAIGTNGDVGIWHETYLGGPGQSETIYVNMPPFGLGLAGTLNPATGPRTAAAQRLNP
jgi:hypothetical protein